MFPQEPKRGCHERWFPLALATAASTMNAAWQTEDLAVVGEAVSLHYHCLIEV
jgi:hypothetical protein